MTIKQVITEGDKPIKVWTNPTPRASAPVPMALGLLAKGNATLIEWLDSPIVYRVTSVPTAALRSRDHEDAESRMILRHPLS